MFDLSHRLHTLKHKDGYDKTDQRDSSFDKLETVTSGYAINLYLERNFVFGKNSVLPKFVTFPEDITQEKVDSELKIWMDNYDIIQRTSFLTLFLFNIEVFLKSMCNQLSIQTKQEKYSFYSKELLKLLFPNDWENRRNIFKLPAECRNILHNGGVYNRKKMEIPVDGITYTFEREVDIEFLTWSNLIKFCDRIVDVLEEICNHPDVLPITHIGKID